MPPPDPVEQMQLGIDAEISRARLQVLIEACGDADILWLSDVVQQAFTAAALAARAGDPAPFQPDLPAYVRAARRRLSFRD